MTFRLVPVNAADTATLSVTPAAVSTLPITNLQSSIRDRLWRSTSLASQVIEGNWAGDVRRISHFSLWPSAQASSLVGSTVRLQVFSDLAMASSVYDQTWDFFTPTGPGWGDDPWGAFQWGAAYDDRTSRLAPLSKWFSVVNASAFRVTISNAGAVDTDYFEARRMVLGEYQEAPYNGLVGMAPQWRSNSEHQRTIGGSLRRLARAKWRELRFETIFSTDEDRAKWSDILQACDPGREVVVSIFPANSSERLERDFTVLGSLEALNPIVFENYQFHRLQLAFTES